MRSKYFISHYKQRNYWIQTNANEAVGSKHDEYDSLSVCSCFISRNQGTYYVTSSL